MGSKPIEVVALVPARGGSKGIPGKNIRPLCGKPLIYWVCKAAEECAYITATYVSTEDETIAAAARAMGLSKVQVIGRAPETATDAASTESVMLDFAERVDFEYIALLQATSPLLRGEDLERGCALLAAGECDSVLSTVRQTRFRWSEQPGGAVLPENYDPRRRPRRQDCQGFMVENGAFYLTSRERLLADRCRIGGRIRAVSLPDDTYFELDDFADWTIIEGLLERRFRAERKALTERLQRIRFVATDVDGCLTDGGMYYSEEGDELKRFDTRDGKGFQLLREAGCLTGMITGEETALVARRAQKLRVDEVHQGVKDKVQALEEILARRGLSWEDVAYLGDGLGDYEALRRAGVAAVPANAVDAVRGLADVVLTAPGGAGAFREFAELILDAKTEP